MDYYGRGGQPDAPRNSREFYSHPQDYRNPRGVSDRPPPFSNSSRSDFNGPPPGYDENFRENGPPRDMRDPVDRDGGPNWNPMPQPRDAGDKPSFYPPSNARESSIPPGPSSDIPYGRDNRPEYFNEPVRGSEAPFGRFNGPPRDDRRPPSDLYAPPGDSDSPNRPRDPPYREDNRYPRDFDESPRDGQLHPRRFDDYRDNRRGSPSDFNEPHVNFNRDSRNFNGPPRGFDAAPDFNPPPRGFNGPSQHWNEPPRGFNRDPRGFNEGYRPFDAPRPEFDRQYIPFEDHFSQREGPRNGSSDFPPPQGFPRHDFQGAPSSDHSHYHVSGQVTNSSVNPGMPRRGFDDSFFSELTHAGTPVAREFVPLDISCSPQSTERKVELIQEFLDYQRVKILGMQPLPPVFEFSEVPLPDFIEQGIRKNGWAVPTPIQSVAIPVALKGRDMIGIAKTGSGKTAAFVIPALIHIQRQGSRPGPHVLVIAPARELILQIGNVTKQFASAAQIRTAIILGGENSRREQQQQLNAGPHIIVATPGRLLDFIKAGAVSLEHVSYVVIDEADRLLEMGFEQQLDAVMGRINPNRQTLMWSATWPKPIRDLAKRYLVNQLQVVIGASEISVNDRILQIIEEVNDYEKFERLKSILFGIADSGTPFKILIFCKRKSDVDTVTEAITKSLNFNAFGTHGDKSQQQRNYALDKFRMTSNVVLIGTDVLARGLDVDDVTHVINYDLPATIEDYVHRIGRTARGVKTGQAISFFSKGDRRISKKLVKILLKTNQEVPSWLQSIADTIEK